MRIERTKLSRKILYHFAIFAIINEKLITKDHRVFTKCKHCKRGKIRPPPAIVVARRENCLLQMTTSDESDYVRAARGGDPMAVGRNSMCF